MGEKKKICEKHKYFYQSCADSSDVFSTMNNASDKKISAPLIMSHTLVMMFIRTIGIVEKYYTNINCNLTIKSSQLGRWCTSVTLLKKVEF